MSEEYWTYGRHGTPVVPEDHIPSINAARRQRLREDRGAYREELQRLRRMVEQQTTAELQQLAEGYGLSVSSDRPSLVRAIARHYLQQRLGGSE